MSTHASLLLGLLGVILIICAIFWLSNYYSWNSREWRKKRKLETEEHLRREAELKKQWEERYERGQEQMYFAHYIGNIPKWHPERNKLVEEYLVAMRIDNPEATIEDAIEEIDFTNSVCISG